MLAVHRQLVVSEVHLPTHDVLALVSSTIDPEKVPMGGTLLCMQFKEQNNCRPSASIQSRLSGTDSTIMIMRALSGPALEA